MTTTVGSRADARRDAPAPGAPRILHVALAGCGTVGGELVRLLRQRDAGIARRDGVRFELSRVLVRDVRRERAERLPPGLLTSDVDTFVEDAGRADIVVEALGGLEPAGRIATEALRRGRVLVTANKTLVAERGEELDSLARRTGGRLLYEAAVAGGVPVIRALRDSLPQTGIRSVRGILNGTTNYVLSRMSEGLRFDAALSEAAVRGFAEADPSRDLDGRDAADKVRILAWLVFQTDPRLVFVHRRGLLPRPDRITADAAAFGGVVKLVAECVVHAGSVIAAVEPMALSADSALARTAGAENLIAVETRHNGTIRLSGPGAGGSPTASALLSDMIHGATSPPSGPDRSEDGRGAGSPGRPGSPGSPGSRECGSPGAAPSTGSGADTRAHAWILSVEGRERAGDQLDAELREEGIVVERRPEDRDGGLVRVLTGPCERGRISSVEAKLEERRLAPVVTRYEAGSAQRG